MPIYVIIGASRGLGYQFIKTLSADPQNTIIATARNVADLETKLKEDQIANTRVVYADLADASSLADAANSTGTLTDGKVDHLLINGAYLSFSTGGMNPTDFADKTDLFLTELNNSNIANVAGLLFAINAFLQLLRAGKEMRVTYISSGVSSVSETLETRTSNSVPYCISKAAGNIVIAKFAAELQDQGFIFLSIAPGAVATEWVLDTSYQTEEDKKKVGVMFARMAKKYPNWKGPIAPEESVARILDVVQRSTVEQSGQFLSYWGNTDQWL